MSQTSGSRFLTNRRSAALLLFALCAFITIGLQWGVGDLTIYSKALESRRAQMHAAILHNQPPAGKTWSEIGAGSHNIRVGTIYLAEGVSRLTGLSIARTYKLIDTVCLFAALVGVYCYARRWVPHALALVGVLYLAAILPLTYFGYYFQPWDRIDLVLWLILLTLIRDARFWGVAGVLALSMFVKFDAILTPGLYLLARINRENWRRTLIESTVLSIIGFGIYTSLSLALPAPGEPSRFGLAWAIEQSEKNIGAFASLNFHHPVLIALALPMVLAIIGIRGRDQFVRASVVFALGMSMIWFLYTVYAELRAQLPAFLLILPSALLSLRTILDRAEADARGPARG